ncbi:MAG: GNAT family N-acetyltransferase [Alteromonadaceae bacterium]|nr:GNAT family N-acetyltransferase [Alteromonadaceae bacterium]
MNVLIKIPTNRFYLKELTKQDASINYLNWFNNSNTIQFIEYKSTDLIALANYIDDKYNDKSCLFLGVFTQDKQIHIGNIKYEIMPKNSLVATMGIMIGDTSWHSKGVAGEVIVASAKYLKSHLNITHVNLGVDINNIAAIKAYEKIGFKRTKQGYLKNDLKNSIEMIYHIN